MSSFIRSGPVTAKRLIRALWDVLSWIVGAVIAMEIRFDFQATNEQILAALKMGLLLALAQVIVGWFFHLYRGRYRTGSLDEVTGITVTVALIASVGTMLVFVLEPDGIPRSIPLLSSVLALGAMMSGRVALRLYRMRFPGADTGKRTVIYGAGDMGEHLLRLMHADRAHTFYPVGYLDDDLRKQRLRTYRVRVLGTLADLEKVVATTEAEVLVVAITRVKAALLRDLDRRCGDLGIELRVVPSTNAMIAQGIGLNDLSAVTVEDLLGRQPIDVDERSISAFLVGKRVLVTGAGGSIGSELCRLVSHYRPAFLGILDRDESAIQAVQLSLDGHGLLDSDGLILADIRDADRMHEVMKSVRPEIVFHAAALKHLPLLEMYPDEAVKTNILGTLNVLEASRAAGVEAFVNISTDKAADPSSVLGLSKLATERLTAGLGDEPGRYLSVRFGNVLGSRGSVLNTFRAQIASGGPVTVTDPDVTRYFMTIPEAVHLVLQASTIGESGNTLILDMGKPVRILAVAEQLIEMSGEEIQIQFVGLRRGEKMHEVLTGAGELPAATSHPLISQVRVAPLEAVTAMDAVHEQAPAMSVLARLALGAGWNPPAEHVR